MIKKEITIENKHGLHARPAALLVKAAGKFKADFFISKDGYEVNGKSIMGVMTLAAEPGSVVLLTFDGADEQEALQAIEGLIKNKFFED